MTHSPERIPLTEDRIRTDTERHALIAYGEAASGLTANRSRKADGCSSRLAPGQAGTSAMARNAAGHACWPDAVSDQAVQPLYRYTGTGMTSGQATWHGPRYPSGSGTRNSAANSTRKTHEAAQSPVRE